MWSQPDQREAGAFHPPPRQDPHDNDEKESSEGSGDGALGATINLVSSAANMFFNSAPAPAPAAATTTVPSTMTTPIHRPGPPPPIDPGTSMLDATATEERVGGGASSYPKRVPSSPRWQQEGIVPSSPLATSKPRVELSQTSPITTSVQAQIQIPSLASSTRAGSSSSGGGGKTTFTAGPPVMPSLPTKAGSFFDNRIPSGSVQTPEPTVPTAVRDAFEGPAATPTDASSRPPKAAHVGRPTPPPSPKPNRFPTPPPSPKPVAVDPATPLRSNQQQAQARRRETTATSSNSTPRGRRPFSLPTPPRKSSMPRPPASGNRSSSSSNNTTPRSSKFRLPPALKSRTPKTTTTTTATSSSSSRSTTNVRQVVVATTTSTSSTVPKKGDEDEPPKPVQTPMSTPPVSGGGPTTVQPEEDTQQEPVIKEESSPSPSIQISDNHHPISASGRRGIPPTPAPTPTGGIHDVKRMEELKLQTMKIPPSLPTLQEPKSLTTSTDAAPPLPEGWAEAKDPSTGNVYYYHASTGETSWERPTPLPKATPPEETTTTTTPAVVVVAPEPSKAESSSPFWSLQGESSSFFSEPKPKSSTTSTQMKKSEPENTPMPLTQEEPPISQATIDDAPPVLDTRAQVLDSNPEDTTTMSPALPDGWTEALDESSGKPYYYHAESGETQWDRPTDPGPALESVDEPALQEPIESAASASASATIVSEDDDDDESADDEDDQDSLLPEGWVQATDEASGKAYYYHADLGETAWERPVGATYDDKEQEEEEEILPDSIEEIHEAASALNLLASSKSSDIGEDSNLPVGWSQVEDPTSGRVYYYNANTNETSWERPSVAEPPSTLELLQEQQQQDETEPASVEVEVPSPEDDEAEQAVTESSPEDGQINDTAQDMSEFGALPAGWSEVEDPTSGRVYYYNANTNETSWERPSVAEPPSTLELLQEQQQQDETEPASVEVEVPSPEDDEAEQAVTESSLEDGQINDTAQDMSEFGALPAGWSEVEDPTSGRVYYYNANTNETSWERPSVAEPPSTLELLQEQQQQGETEPASLEVEVPSPEDDEPKQAVTESTPEDGQVDDAAQDMSEFGVLPAGWSEVDDPTSGRVYYYNANTNETSWERPSVAEPPSTLELLQEQQQQDETEPASVEVEVPSPEDDEAEQAVTESSPEDGQINDTAQDMSEFGALPAGWSEVEDPTSGRVYYYNANTNETSWERPSVAEPPSTLELLQEQQQQGETEPASLEVEVPSPEDDEPKQAVTESTPEDGQVDDAAQDLSEFGVLPAGWSEVDDPTSGRVYYYNANTNETSWERPSVAEPPSTLELLQEQQQQDETEPASVEVEVPSPEDDEAEQAVTESSLEDGQINDTAQDMSEFGALPAGWSEVEDPTSGRVYYYNANTNETSWERPSVAEPPSTLELLQEQQQQGETEPASVEVEVPSSEDNEPEQAVTQPSTSTPEQVDDAPQDMSEFGVLPAGWSEVEDPTSGRVYYYNATTEETSWERPSIAEPPSTLELLQEQQQQGETEPASVEVEVPSPEDNEHEPLATESTPPMVEQVDDGPQYSSEVANTEDQVPLAAGWAEVEDPVSGSIYYYHEASGESSWDPPTIEESSMVAKSSQALQQQAIEEIFEHIEGEATVHDGEPETAIEEGSTQDAEDKDALQFEADNDEQGGEIVLPPSWSKVSDDTTGQFYYYNETTGETSWNPPAIAQPPSTDFLQEKEQEIEESTRLEVDLPAVEDTKEIVDDKLVQNAQEENSRVLLAPDTLMEKKTPELPLSWSEVQDPTSGQVYYYNASTGETSWERPILEEPSGTFDLPTEQQQADMSAIVQQHEHPVLEEPETTVEDTRPEAVSVPPTSLLPPHWSEMEDPDTGLTYFFNSMTGETSWDHPQPESTALTEEAEPTDFGEEDPTHEAGAALDKALDPRVDEGTSNRVVDEQDAGSDVLPVGCMETTDSAGATYYYNSTTGETSQDRPEVDEVSPLEDNAGRSARNAVLDTGASGNDVLEEPELTIEKPVDDPTENLHDDEVQLTATGDVILPDGWAEVAHEGQTYYYNTNTGETSWDRPMVEEADTLQKEENQKAVDDIFASMNAEFGIAEEGDEIQGESAGYPHHSDSQSSPQSEPLATAEAQAEVDYGKSRTGDEGEGAFTLPAGWVETFDESTGTPYYYNAESGESSWSRPAGDETTKSDNIAEGKESSTDAADATQFQLSSRSDTKGSDENKGEESERVVPESRITDSEYDWPSSSDGESSEDDSSPANSEKTSDDDSQKVTAAALPNEWSAVPDGNGNIYYYNTVTHETSWDLPSGVKASKAMEKDEGSDVQQKRDSDDALVVDSELPSNWTKVEDASSGTYYFNEVTGETSWEFPTSTPTPIDTQNASREKDPTTYDDLDEVPSRGDTVEIPSVVPSDNEDSTQATSKPKGNQAHSGHDEAKPFSASELELPMGWVESIDPDSQQRYFYNSETGATSWDFPTFAIDEAPLETPSALDARGLDAGPDEAAGETSDPSTEVAGAYMDTSPSLPDGWEEVTDPATGDRYFYHAASSTTSWEIPASTLEEISTSQRGVDGEGSADAHQGTEVHSESVAADHRPTFAQLDTADTDANNDEPELFELPEFWTQAIDESSGETYYFNTLTQETSWKRPEAGIKDDGVPSSNTFTNPDVGEEPAGHVDDRDATVLENTAVEPPHGWSAILDSQSGETYYVNENTGETAWLMPTVDLDQNNAVETAMEGEDVTAANNEDLGDGVGASDAPITSRPGLAQGWSPFTDPQSGDTYYVNDATGETRWDTPSGDTQEDPATETVDVVGHENKPESKENDTLPDGWAAIEDDVSGKTYFFNERTGETMWERPSAFLTDDDDECAGDTLCGESNEEGPPSLPLGWEEVIDETSGDVYYFNEQTGATSWDFPTVEVEDEVQSAPPIPVEEVSKPEKLEGLPDADLPEGWRLVVDEDSGDVYYVNDVDNTTSWEKPPMHDSEDGVIVDRILAGSEGKLDLPDGWVVVHDEQSGDPYYMNEKTNETRWSKPEPSSAIEAAPTSGDSWVDLQEGQTKTTMLCELLSHEEWASTSKYTDEQSLAALYKSRGTASISGTLIGADDDLVMQYIRQKSSSDSDILWRLIEVTANAKGRLRSDAGVHIDSSPEFAIVKILLDDSGKAYTPKAMSSGDIVESLDGENSSLDKDAVKERVEVLLVQGKRKEAVEEAIAGKDFATALFLADACDPETIHRAKKAFTENAFDLNSPINTVAMLFSGAMQPSDTSSGASYHWGVSSAELKASWKRHLAGIISNRVSGWDTVVLSLGDRLREVGAVPAAHFCYMVVGCPVSSPLEEGTRICLLGCNHADTVDRALCSAEAIEAFDRTEAYEWAKRRGNKNATLTSFQPFKIIYAARLIDAGLVEQAAQYISSTQANMKSSDVNRHEGDASLTLSSLFQTRDAQARAIKLLGKRLGIEGTIPASNAAKPPHSGYKASPVANDLIAGRFEEEKEEIADLDTTFLSAKSNLMDKTGFTLTPERHSTSPRTGSSKPVGVPPSQIIEESPVVASKSNLQPPMIPESPSAGGKRPAFLAATKPAPGPNLSALPPRRNDVDATPKARGPSSIPATPPIQPAVAINPPAASVVTPQAATTKPKAAPSTAPSALMGKKQAAKKTPKPAPSSAGKKGGLSLRQRLVKWINPDATEVTLPDDSEKPYYDKDKKVWVFPGEDPAEVAKPIAPPPTMASVPTEPAEPEPMAPLDPLAALMAPPSARTPASMRRSTPGSARPPLGVLPPGMPPPMGGTATPAAAPPQFAVFKPKATPKEEKSSDES